MKVLRIKLTQTKSSYARREAINNRMTYPLPPYSTIIGALHNACGYTSYKPMEISVQGKYRSMQREVYVNHTLLNNLQDDRGVLIWLKNPNAFNGGYIKVAEALKSQGNSFYEKKTIRISDAAKLEDYIALKNLGKLLEKEKNEKIKNEEKIWKREKQLLNETLSKLDSRSNDAIDIKKRIKSGNENIAALKKDYKNEKYERVDKPLSHFRTLAKGPKLQEVLYDVELVIHIKADESILKDIMDNKNNFVALGRSEDFIDLKEMKLVELTNKVDREYHLKDNYAMYINANVVDLDKKGYGDYFLIANGQKKNADGTIYNIDKDYVIRDKKRIFNHIPCLYSAYVAIDSDSEKALLDKDGGYIVDLN